MEHQTSTTQDAAILALAASLDGGADMTNAHRGARVLRLLFGLYHDSDPESVTRDALADIMHACDLAGLGFWLAVQRARENYGAEILDGGCSPLWSEVDL